MGLVNAIAPQGKLLETAEKFFEAIKQKGPLSIIKAKELLHKSRFLSFERGLEEETKSFGKLFSSKDAIGSILFLGFILSDCF